MREVVERRVSPFRRKKNRVYNSDNNEAIINSFANAVTNPFNQDVAMLLEGHKGSGKSYASLRLAYNTARRIADIKDGDPNEWPKYFTMKNVAIIDPQKAFDIMSKAKKYNVYLYDDIGVGWNARTFTTKENQNKNDIFQVNRISRTVQIMSLPNQFLIDKVPRMLCNYVAEMVDSKFEHGLSIMKIFKPKTIFRLNNKRMTPTLIVGDSKIVRYIVHKPPQFLCDAYDKMRAEITEVLLAQRYDSIYGEQDGEKGLTTLDRAAKMEVRIQNCQLLYDQLIMRGNSHREARKILINTKDPESGRSLYPAGTINTWHRNGQLIFQSDR